MEKIKNRLIPVITVLVIIIIAVTLYFIFKNTVATKKQFGSSEGITVVLTMNDELKEDTIWCGTFQLIWNDLKNDIAKQNIIFTNHTSLTENLNLGDFDTSKISEDAYYKKVGIPSQDLKREIEKEINEKFNETSDILDSFDWDNTDSYILYCMLKKEFEFEYEFDTLENSVFADKYPNIKYFGIKNSTKDEVKNQVEVLYYNSKSDFAIKLKTKGNDEIILTNSTRETLNEIYNNVKSQEQNYQGNKKLENNEIVKIPNIDFKKKSEFTEFENKEFEISSGEFYYISKAIQTIEFELNKKGGKIKSEAGMQVNSAGEPIETHEIREFILDNTFTIFLQEKDKDMPYFAAQINDITKFQ